MRADVLSKGRLHQIPYRPRFHNRYQYLLGSFRQLFGKIIRVMVKTNIEASTSVAWRHFSTPPATPTTLHL